MAPDQPVRANTATLPAVRAGMAEPGAATGNQALVPDPPLPAKDSSLSNGPIPRLPVELDVTVPVEEFRVRDLLALQAGKVISSRWNHGKDVPLSAGDVQLAWSEFEVIDGQLGVRVTRLP